MIETERIEDRRGFFARAWSPAEARTHGINVRLEQCSIAFNKTKGTLRGMHFQKAPHQETKLVRCTMGSIYDVIIDLRKGSPTRLKWTAVTLTSENRRMLYVPEGFAHGYITLKDSSEVFYQISAKFNPTAASGVRWNDPAFGIKWPRIPSVINPRDRDYPNFNL